MKRGAKKLYAELGPVLFARAKRVLQDEQAAQEVTLAVVEELAALGKLPTLELVREGRARVKLHCARRSPKAFDSLGPFGPGPGR